MSTLRRDLRQKFEEILVPMLSDNPQTAEAEEFAKELAEKLTNAALEIVRKPSFDMSKAGLDWAVLSGEVTQEAIDQNKLAEEAKGAFERDLHFNPLPWSSTKDWEKLEKFVIDQFKKDNQVFFKYDSWRKGKGKFAGALNNKNITQTPSNFIACFPDFLAHTAMYPEKIEPKPTQTSFLGNDEDGIPISR